MVTQSENDLQKLIFRNSDEETSNTLKIGYLWSYYCSTCSESTVVAREHEFIPILLLSKGQKMNLLGESVVINYYLN